MASIEPRQIDGAFAVVRAGPIEKRRQATTANLPAMTKTCWDEGVAK